MFLQLSFVSELFRMGSMPLSLFLRPFSVPLDGILCEILKNKLEKCDDSLNEADFDKPAVYRRRN